MCVGGGGRGVGGIGRLGIATDERGVSFIKGSTDLGSKMSNLQKRFSVHILSLIVVGLQIITLL